jgi:hypothetical protein
MENISGIIVSQKNSEKGYWYTLHDGNTKHRFFSCSSCFSLFEKCEATVERKNVTFFLREHFSDDNDAPLKSKPSNLLAASWLSQLADSLCGNDIKEVEFITRCHVALKENFTLGLLEDIENDYIRVSGFSSNSIEETIEDCFPYSGKLRRSLINQLKIRG